jgi:hypothetical protein
MRPSARMSSRRYSATRRSRRTGSTLLLSTLKRDATTPRNAPRGPTVSSYASRDRFSTGAGPDSASG